MESQEIACSMFSFYTQSLIKQINQTKLIKQIN